MSYIITYTCEILLRYYKLALSFILLDTWRLKGTKILLTKLGGLIKPNSLQALVASCSSSSSIEVAMVGEIGVPKASFGGALNES